MEPACKTLEIPEALALAQDPEHGDQQQVTDRDTQATPHAGIRDRLEKAAQIKIGCGRGYFGHRKEANPADLNPCSRPRQERL